MKKENACCPLEIKRYALEMLDDPVRLQEIRSHLETCTTCKDRLEEEKHLSRQLKRLPKVVVPLDFSMAVMQKVRLEAGVTSSPKKSWTVWAIAASAVFAFAMVSGYWPYIINNPLWDHIIIDSFGVLVGTLESGIRASLAIGHAAVLTLQMIGGVLTYFSRISAGVPTFWFMALSFLFILSNTICFFLLRKQEHNS